MDKALEKFSGITESINTMYNHNGELNKVKSFLKNIYQEIQGHQQALEQNTLSRREICQAHGITEPTLIKRRNAGLIPFVKLGRKFYYLKPEADKCY